MGGPSSQSLISERLVSSTNQGRATGRRGGESHLCFNPRIDIEEIWSQKKKEMNKKGARDMQDGPTTGTHEKQRQAVVIGAGIAGLLATRVLAEYYEQVLVVERDTDRHDCGSPELLMIQNMPTFGAFTRHAVAPACVRSRSLPVRRLASSAASAGGPVLPPGLGST